MEHQQHRIERELQLPPDLEPLLIEAGAATVLGLTAHGLARLSKTDRGPPFIKIGDRVKYRPSDLRAWTESRRFISVAAAAAADRSAAAEAIRAKRVQMGRAAGQARLDRRRRRKPVDAP
jgi:hypothetical protein